MKEKDQKKYGPFSGLVTAAGYIISSAFAIGLAFRGRSIWEPSEQDISHIPQRIALLGTAGIMVIVWTSMSSFRQLPQLMRFAKALGIGVLVSFIVYGWLVWTRTYNRVISPAPNQTVTERIIGGFWLTPEAKERKTKYNETVQEILEGAAYDPDHVWSRDSQAAAKWCFWASYICLMVCGSGALVCLATITQINLVGRNSRKKTG